jgi:hypothetical protein
MTLKIGMSPTVKPLSVEAYDGALPLVSYATFFAPGSWSAEDLAEDHFDGLLKFGNARSIFQPIRFASFNKKTRGSSERS